MIDLMDIADRLERIAPAVGRLKGDRVIKIDPNDAMAVSKARAAIRDRYDEHAERRVDVESKIPLIAFLRITELERYLGHRYGHVLPDDAAGREDLTILLNHVAQNRTDAGGKMLGFIGKLAPWMDATERLALTGKILKKPRRYKASTLGKLLRLTEEERVLLEITTIRAFDATDEDMREMKRARDRAAQKAKRAANRSGRGRGRPKSEGPQPWEAAGASSKSAHYRNRKKAEVGGTKNASPPLEGDSYADDGISVPRESATAGAIIRASAIDLDPIDLKLFGIVAIKVMSGTSIISEWRADP